jgi:zinc protease
MPAWIACTLVAASLTTQTPVPKAITKKLDSGVTLIVQEDHAAPIVGIEVFVKAGTARETADTLGCAHMMEHIAFRGTKAHPGNAIDAAAEKLGYRLLAATQKEIVHYTATCLSKDWKSLLGLIADAIINPAPDERAFQAERRVVMQEYFARRDNPMEFLYDTMYGIAYGKTGYGAPTGGDPESIQALTLAKTLDFWKQWYESGNTYIAVVGDVQAADVQKEVELWFNLMPRGAGSPIPALRASEGKVVDEKGPFTKAALSFAYPSIPAKRIEDSAVLDILTGLMMNRRKELDGAIAFDVRYSTESNAEIVVLMLFCEESALADLTEKTKGLVAKIAAGEFSEAEFQAARNKALAQELYQVETPTGRAFALAYWAATGDEATTSRYQKTLASATIADAKRVAREVFNPAKAMQLTWHVSGQ